MVPILNVTPHPITFAVSADDPSMGTYVVEPCGIVISAQAVEQPTETSQLCRMCLRPVEHARDGCPAYGHQVSFVRTAFTVTHEQAEVLRRLEEEHPGAIIVGSIIAAQAFPGRVCAMIPAPGFERVPTDQKRMRADKFTVFEEGGS